MGVHGRSFLEYWDENQTPFRWQSIPMGDLQRVEYTDSIYSPARLSVVISNRNMNRSLSDSVDASSGTYSVEGEGDNPTFRRFQPIRLFHAPRAIYTQNIAHDGNAGNDVEFTLATHGLSVGDHINLINESTGRLADDTYAIKAVQNVNTFTLYARSLDYPNKWIADVRGTGDNGTILLSHKGLPIFYPLFFGRTESVDVSYSDQVGKQISIRALDYLAGLKDEIITASLNEAPSSGEAFNATSTKKGTATGQFKGVTYPPSTDTSSHKLSETIKSIITDWSYGKDLYTDNTYDGTTDMGASKFENSSFEFHGKDDGKFRHFAGRDTKVLNAMRNVAMSERHAASTDAEGGAGVPITADIVYITSGDTDYAGSLVISGANRDVVIEEPTHGYENGNMVTITTDSLTLGTDHIDDAAWVVTASASGHFKIKDLGGTIKQISTANNTGRTVKISPALTGSFGYDFYLDSGFYADNVDYEDLTAHRPHLNYFLRGSRPVDPESTGLTLKYPSQGDESEDVFGWGLVADSGRINTTKMFLLPQFECGLNSQDLYSHIGLAAVSTDDANPTDINDLGHKLELLKVNSISTEDWVSALPVSTAAERQAVAAYSGVKDGRGKFHWERSDSCAGLGWIFATNDSNRDYFSANSTGSGVSVGTYGAIAELQGGYYKDNSGVTGNTGLAGLSVLPSNGRSFIDPPDTLTDPTKETTESILDQPAYSGPSDDIKEGGSALTAADLLKDVYNVEIEGLLSAEVTGGTHNGNASELTVTKGAHGMKTGTIIKITQLDAATSGTYGGLKVNTAPTRVNPNSDTTDTGSYYRVQRVSDSTFKITTCQKHRSQIIGGLGISVNIGSSRHFRYKMAYHIFKHACRIQRVTGNTWSSGTNDTVLRTSEAKNVADYALISDVKKKDKPYRGMNVNNLIAGSTGNTNGGGYHPASLATSKTTEYGTITVTSGLGWCTVPHYSADRFQESGDPVKVRFAYGDYLSETRFLYGDRNSGDPSVGVRGLVGQTMYQVAESASGEHTSQDVFKSTNCKILSRLVDEKSISKTYQLKYNESASSRDTIRDAAVQLLKRAILPSKRTTSKVFGYPVIKLTGAAQSGTGHLLGNPLSGTDHSVLVPIDNPVAYGGRAGMLVEKTIGLDGTPVNMTFPNIVNSTFVDGNLLLGGADDGRWAVGDFYRMYIHLRAGFSVRLENPPAGVVGNHIITSLTYYERMGTTETTLETTGYDEAQLAKFGPLATLLETIKTAGSNLKPTYITVDKLKATAANDRIWYFG